MKRFIIQVNGNIVIMSGKHYALGWACGTCSDAANLEPGKYLYDNKGQVTKDYYTHLIEGDLILNNDYKTVPYATYFALKGLSCNVDEGVECYCMGRGVGGAYNYFMDNISELEKKISGNDGFIYKSLFVDVFSTLELFLSDFLLSCIYSYPDCYDNAIAFFKKKCKEDDKLFVEKSVHKYFFRSINYHRFENLRKIMYEILNVDLPEFDEKYLYKRNNIVHRASLSGDDRMRMTIITEELLRQFISEVKVFARELVDRQAKSTLNYKKNRRSSEK